MNEHHVMGMLFYIAAELLAIIIILGVIHKELKGQRKP